MSTRNLSSYRDNYRDEQLTDDESSESMSSYMDNVQLNRNISRRNSTGRSIRSVRNSPQHSFDGEIETSSRPRQNRERRASSSTRSVSSRTDRRAQRLRSDSTQESETEMGTRALVQAKIREKVAQASSMDESSSDLWKPKTNTQNKTQKNAVETIEKTKEKKEKSPMKILNAKHSVNNSRIEKNTASKVSTEVQTTPPRENSISRDQNATKNQPISNSTTNDEQVNQNNKPIPDTSLDIGPPPTTPNYEWECEFCTFTNEPNTKICAICCKTPTTTAIRTQSIENKPPINGRLNERAEISKEGRNSKISRKISFWPGTKSK